MDFDPAFFGQRIAMLSILSGFIGALLWTLVHGAAVALSDCLRSRANRAERIAQARIRQQAILRVLPRG